MDRLSEKLDLIVKLGMLFGPLQRLAESPGEFDEQERAETIARFLSEQQTFCGEFLSFSKGQLGHDYQLEYRKVVGALRGVGTRIELGHDLRDIVSDNLPTARDGVHAVPVPRSSVIHEAGTPFTAYCKLRSLCEADALTSMTWFDPYFGPDIFHRYLQFTDPRLRITLVASEPSHRAGNKNRERWISFLDISQLFAQERGPQNYRLLVARSMHDRWLVFDAKRIYALGGSAKDAASKDMYTISTIDASMANLQAIEDTISKAEEWFGPNIVEHATS